MWAARQCRSGSRRRWNSVRSALSPPDSVLCVPPARVAEQPKDESACPSDGPLPRSGFGLVTIAPATGEAPERLHLSGRAVRIGLKARRPHDGGFILGADRPALEPGEGSLRFAVPDAS